MLPTTVVTKALGRRLVARRLYPVICCVIVVAAGIAAVLGGDYAPGSLAERIDRAVDGRLIARFGGHIGLARGLVDLGGPVPILVTMSALVIPLLALGRLRGALFAASAPPVATSITEWILKPLVGRMHAGQAYPSGHATAFCAVACVVVVLALGQRARRLPGSLLVIVSVGALGLVVCVCVALVAAQYHVATDTIGAVCVALVTVLTLALVIDGVADRRATRHLHYRMGESHRAAG